jgi:leucyl-tRNA synthetase
MGYETTIHIDTWPKWDDAYLQAGDMKTIIVQVNGKLRGKIEAPTSASEDEVKKAAQDEPNVQKFLDGKTPTKVIYVPGRLVNIVIK